jgi:general secretion pathway protein G
MLLQTARNRATRRAAFTLLEILVVVAIVVILAGVGVVATTTYLEKAKQNKAQLACKALADACEAYYLDPSNGGQYPTEIGQLVQPPNGGRSLLRNGIQDTYTPWPNVQQQYTLEIQTKADGTQYPFVHCRADDGTQISQFGTGQKANPPY